MGHRKNTLPEVFIRLRLNAAGDSSCLPPQPPSRVPDGRTATEAEMIAAMRRFRKYNTDVEAYLRCLELAARNHRISAPVHIKMHNEMVDALHRNVGRFNLQVRTYKAKVDVSAAPLLQADSLSHPRPGEVG